MLISFVWPEGRSWRLFPSLEVSQRSSESMTEKIGIVIEFVLHGWRKEETTVKRK